MVIGQVGLNGVHVAPLVKEFKQEQELVLHQLMVVKIALPPTLTLKHRVAMSWPFHKVSKRVSNSVKNSLSF